MRNTLEALHPIGVVAERTGLSPHVIRVWERRYRALQPGRTPANRRLYTDEEVRRLALLRDATRGPRTIGQVAGLSAEELQELVASDAAHGVGPGLPAPASLERAISQALDAIGGLDARALDAALSGAAVSLSLPALLETVLGPLLARVGDAWEQGHLRVAHEHLATAAIRTLLGELIGRYAPPAGAPLLLATTPSGQLHEMGALLAAATGVTAGWGALYLGPNLPAEEIAGAVKQHGVRALALSLIYPPDDPNVARELFEIRRLLGDSVSVLVGGQAARAYARVLAEAHMETVEDLPAFRARLSALRVHQASG